MPLNASIEFSINSIFWLRSLRDAELGPTRRVIEDLEPFFERLGLPMKLYDLKTPSDLYRVLDGLAQPSIKPILQFDMHGTKEGLILAGAGGVARWEEVVPRLRAINVASGGNLCVVAGVCFAFYAMAQSSISLASPVNVLIAPDREVQNAKLEDGLARFYTELFSGGDILAAFRKHLGDPFKVFLAERFFVIAVSRYIRNFCKGKGAAKRREDLLSDVLLMGQPRTADNLLRIRRQIKEGIRPDQKMLDRYAYTFLLGKPCPFSIDQLISAVQVN